MYKVYLFLNIGLILSFLQLFLAKKGIAQNKKIIKAEVFYDSTALPEIFRDIPVGIKFTFSDHSVTSTRGIAGGKIRWKDIDIHTKQGTIDNGELHFDPEKVWRNRHRISFKINYAGQPLSYNMSLPYLQKIRLNLYTDSIKPGVPFYLNVEGIFTNGKVLPLDTGQLQFYASGGQLKNNILLLPKTDSALRQIFIRTVFKWDATLADSLSLPVKKHIEKAELPTEEELFRKWKRKKLKKHFTIHFYSLPLPSENKNTNGPDFICSRPIAT